MILQSITIPVVLFLVINFRTDENEWARWTCYVLIHATVIVTVWSGLPYVVGMRRLVKPEQGETPA